MINGVRDVSSVLRGLGNIQLDYKFHFLPDLHFNVNAGYDYTKSDGHKFKDALSETVVSKIKEAQISILWKRKTSFWKPILIM